MDKLLFKKILIASLTILALVYVAYLLLSANFDMYPTENAIKTTITENIYTNGYVIRDESILTNNTNGVLSYSCENGEEVKVNGEIAKIYDSESDAVSQSIADSLEEEKNALVELQNMNILGSVGLDTINNDISNNLISFYNNINDNNLNSALSHSSSLVYNINQRQLYTGKVKNFNTKIADLQNQIDTLRNSSGDSIGTLTTDRAGYFTEFCDGYETAVKYKDIDKMTLQDLHNIEKSNIPSNSAGKVVSSLNWYVACEVTSDQATNLSLWDGSVSVLFSGASTEIIPAEIFRIHQTSQEDNALVILRCDYMDESLIDTRLEPIEIGLGTYTGLRVSKKAIHDDYVTKTTYDDNNDKHTETKKVQGVYVLYGSEVIFKQISIIYADDDYVICETNPDEGVLFNGETISMYDQVILQGDDLYDGKVIH